jgi:ribosomal protein L32
MYLSRNIYTYKTKDRVTRTPLKIGGELRCSGRVCSSCSTSGTRHVNLVTNPVISREWGKDREVFTTCGTYPWSFLKQILFYMYICFVDRCLSFCTFSFRHCVVRSSSIYGFWLSLWYLQALLIQIKNFPMRSWIKFSYKSCYFQRLRTNNDRRNIYTYKTKDRVTRTPLKTGGELRCSGRVCSSCSTSGTRRVNLVTNPVISRELQQKRWFQFSHCELSIYM